MLRLRGRRVRVAMGINKSAHLIEGWLVFWAVVFGVAMVRVKVLVVDPGVIVGGLKDAVARLGRPVAARVIGLDIVGWSWAEKV